MNRLSRRHALAMGLGAFAPRYPQHQSPLAPLMAHSPVANAYRYTQIAASQPFYGPLTHKTGAGPARQRLRAES